MAIKTNKGIAVAIQHVSGDGTGDVLQVGTGLWNAIVPTSVRGPEGPIVVSVGLLQSHAGAGKRGGASLFQSVTCWAVHSRDVQVSDRL